MLAWPGGLAQVFRPQPEEQHQHDQQVHDGDQGAEVGPGPAQRGQVPAERQDQDERAQRPRSPAVRQPLRHLVGRAVNIVVRGGPVLRDLEPQVVELWCFLAQQDRILHRRHLRCRVRPPGSHPLGYQAGQPFQVHGRVPAGPRAGGPGGRHGPGLRMVRGRDARCRRGGGRPARADRRGHRQRAGLVMQGGQARPGLLAGQAPLRRPAGQVESGRLAGRDGHAGPGRLAGRGAPGHRARLRRSDRRGGRVARQPGRRRPPRWLPRLVLGHAGPSAPPRRARISASEWALVIIEVAT